MVQQNQQKNINRILQEYPASTIYSIWMQKHHNLPCDIQHLILIFTGCTKMQLMVPKKKINCECKFFITFYLMTFEDMYYQRWLCSYNVSHIPAI